MKIALISQRIFKDKYNQIHFSLEDKWINFFKKKDIILIPVFSNQKNLDFYFKRFKPCCLIISGGSNNIFKSTYENILRREIDLKLLKISIKNKIPILTVCYGFQYIVKLFSGTIFKSQNEIKKKHDIFINQKKQEYHKRIKSAKETVCQVVSTI